MLEDLSNEEQEYKIVSLHDADIDLIATLLKQACPSLPTYYGNS